MALKLIGQSAGIHKDGSRSSSVDKNVQPNFDFSAFQKSEYMIIGFVDNIGVTVSAQIIKRGDLGN